MASSKSSSIDLQKLKKDVWAFMPKPEQELTEEQKKQIDDLITKCHQKVTSISESLSRAKVGESTPHSEIEGLLRPHIGSENLEAIRSAFERETFTLHIDKEGSGHVAKFLQENRSFRPAIRLLSMENVEETTAQQIGSLVVEIFFLLFSLAGIRLPLNGGQIQRVTREVIEVVNTKAGREIVTELVRRCTSTSAWQRATAIWDFILGLYHRGYLNTIIRIFFREMSFWETSLAIAQIGAIIVLGLGSGGAAIIAQIVLATIDMGRMAVKIRNMLRLQNPGEFRLQ